MIALQCDFSAEFAEEHSTLVFNVTAFVGTTHALSDQ